MIIVRDPGNMMGSISSEDQEAHPSSSSSSDLAHHHHFLQLTLPQLLPPPPPHLSLSLSSASSSTSSSLPSFQCQTFNSVPATTPQMRQLLIKCAELTSQSDFSAAHRLLVLLLERSSPDGDSVERLVHHFAKAISFRLNNIINPSVNNFIPFIFSSPSSTISTSNLNQQPACSDALHHSTFLTLNKITPFIRFIHLTANQAILEAVDGESDIHILDFDIMQGFQWPPFMQALAERFSSSVSSDHHHPPMLRITGTGHDMDVLMRTGDRLLKFAQSLNLRFQFNPLLLHHTTNLSSLFTPLLQQHETLAVNCILHLHKFTDETLYKLLSTIKSLNPRIVTFAEREANHKTPIFLHRFVEALDHYSAIFNSLEANLPPSSQERLAVEQVWFGSEIMDIVGVQQGANRREMHRRFESWEVMLRSSGFSKVPLSSFAFSQAKLLLRLHYPSEGYKIQNFSDCFFLSWKSRLLFSISSWH